MFSEANQKTELASDKARSICSCQQLCFCTLTSALLEHGLQEATLPQEMETRSSGGDIALSNTCGSKHSCGVMCMLLTKGTKFVDLKRFHQPELLSCMANNVLYYRFMSSTP